MSVTVPLAPWVTAVTVSVSPLSAPSLSLASTSIAVARAVLGHRRRVVDRDRVVVDRRHRDVDRGRRRAAVAVADRVGEAVGAEVVGVRRVASPRAAAGDRHRAPLRALGDGGHRQRLAGVRRRCRWPARRSRWRALSSATVAASSTGDRVVVDRRHRDVDRRRGACRRCRR